MEEGIAVMDRALAQNPNSADALAMSGTLRAYMGDTQAALQHLRMAERMAPLDVHVDFRSFGFYLAAGTRRRARRRPAGHRRRGPLVLAVVVAFAAGMGTALAAAADPAPQDCSRRRRTRRPSRPTSRAP